MEESKGQNRRIPFRGGDEAVVFQRELVLRLIKEVDRRRTQLIPPENMMVFQHGTTWSFQRLEKTGFERHSGNLELKSSTVEMQLQRIVAHDCDLLADLIQQMADGISQQSTAGLLKEMENVSQESGNTFSIPKTGLTPELFLELIQKTEALVGPDGTVHKPSFFNLPEELVRKLAREVEQLGPEFKARIDNLWQEKEREAREREAARLARFG